MAILINIGDVVYKLLLVSANYSSTLGTRQKIAMRNVVDTCFAAQHVVWFVMSI